MKKSFLKLELRIARVKEEYVSMKFSVARKFVDFSVRKQISAFSR